MASVLASLECIQLYYLFNTFADADTVAACQDGTLTSADTPTDLSGMTVVSTNPNAWLGASLTTSGNDLMQTVATECPTECHLSD
jgi:hypothetical protein